MPNSVERHVGKRVRQRRSLKGMTLEDLADRAGVSYQQMQKYETGGNRISVSRLWKIAEALEVPIRYFFEGLEITIEGPTNEPLPDDFLTDPKTLELVRVYYALSEFQRQKLLELACAMGEPAQNPDPPSISGRDPG